MPSFHRLLLLPLLTFASSSLVTASPLSSRSTTYYGLVFAPNSGCSPDQTTQVLNAMTDMRALCNSAISALQPPINTLSAYFFPSSYFSSATALFNATLFAIQPLQDLPTDSSLGYNQIQLYCATETDATCNTPSPGNNYVNDKSSQTTTWGYIGANPVSGSGSTAQIYVCPAMLNGTLPRNAPPCTGTPTQPTLGWAFLRTFVQLQTLQPWVPGRATSDTIADRAPGVEQSRALVESRSNQSSLNADNYAELALWALNIGVGGNTALRFPCPQLLPAT